MYKWVILAGSLLATTGCVGYVVQGPPPPRYAVVGVAPGPQYVWADGYWDWRGAWVWAPGRLVVRPRPYAVWAPARWERRGRRWAFIRGHWR